MCEIGEKRETERERQKERESVCVRGRDRKERVCGCVCVPFCTNAVTTTPIPLSTLASITVPSALVSTGALRFITSAYEEKKIKKIKKTGGIRLKNKTQSEK